MSVTLVDSSVLLNILDRGSPFRSWAKSEIDAADARGGAAVNVVVWAEVAAAFRDAGAMSLLEDEAFLRRLPIPWDAAELAGVAHREYRRRGGLREAALPDFLIAAHAAFENLPLLTRDARRARTAFPGMRIIAPEGT